MRKLFYCMVALVFAGALAVASTYTNQSFGPAGSSSTTLTLTSVGGANGQITIPVTAAITVKDANGVSVNPQPSLTITPNNGTSSHEIQIKVSGGGTFPAGGSITFSRLDTTGTDSPPTAMFSN